MCYTIYYGKDMGLLSDPIEQLVGWSGRWWDVHWDLPCSTVTPLLPKEVAWCLFQIFVATRHIFRCVMYCTCNRAKPPMISQWHELHLSYSIERRHEAAVCFFCVGGKSLQPSFCNYGTISYFGSCPVVEGYTMIILWFTLPETNSSHLKMDAWNTIVSGANRSFWGG